MVWAECPVVGMPTPQIFSHSTCYPCRNLWQFFTCYMVSFHTHSICCFIPAILPIAYLLEILLYSVVSYAVSLLPAMPFPQLASLANSSFKTQYKCNVRGRAAKPLTPWGPASSKERGQGPAEPSTSSSFFHRVLSSKLTLPLRAWCQ